MSKLITYVVFLVSISLYMTTASQAKRIALVIGNDDYANVSRLQKAVNDAKAVSNTIRDIGFEVIESLNANRRTFDQQLNDLNAKVNAGDEVLFFFAGHGISVKGRNFLLPVDIPKITPGQERSVIKEAFSEDEIISLLQERGAKVSLLIIDACRNNPFPKDGTRSVGRSVGLGQRSTPPRNTFVMYSAGFGQEALDRLSDDDQNPNSIFTRKLLPLLKTPGLSHIQMAKQLQIEVEQLALTTKSKHQQFPAFYDQVRGDFFLVPVKKNKAKTIGTPSINADETLWKTIENSTKASDFEFYLSKFPKGRYAAVAELKIKQLKETKVAIGIYPNKKPFKRSYKPGDTFKDCAECPEMVVIPPGEFIMGSPKNEKDRYANEGPQQKVKIAYKFAVGKYKLKRDEWDDCISDGGCFGYWPRDPGEYRQIWSPVQGVSWRHAKAYTKWLSKKTGHSYRLLTESEWEYVARAGTKTPYWWGRKFNYIKQYRTIARRKNNFGVYGMLASVWEWTEDCYYDSYRNAPNDGSARVKNGAKCKKRVVRGGSYEESCCSWRSASRSFQFIDSKYLNYGFRIARTISE